MGEWKEYKLKDAPIKIIDGDRGVNYPKLHEFLDSGYCLFLSTKNVRESGFSFSECQFISHEKDLILRKGKLERYDTVLTTRGTIGNLGYYGDYVPYENMRINSGMVIIRPDNTKVLPKFCYYTFKHLQSSFIEHVSGSAQPQLPIKDLHKITIALPSIEKQKEITSILGSLDEKIDLLNRQNTTLESMAETYFRQHFVEDVQPNLEDGVIADIVDFNPTRKLPKNTIAPFLEMANLSTATYAPSNWYDRAFTSGTKFMNGDTILARITPCLENGKGAYIDFLEDNQIAWGSTEYIIMRPKLGLHPFFAYIVSRYQDFRDFAESCMQGSSGRQRVDVENLKSYEIKIPDLETINKFNNFTATIVEKMHENNAQIRTLTELRDILLPKLMSNELKLFM